MKGIFALFIFGVCLLPAVVRARDLQIGWTPKIIGQLSSLCTGQMLSGARRGYYARAKQLGDQRPKPFPEAQARQGISDLCACLMETSARKWPFEDFSKHSGRDIGSLFERVKKGELCVPKGLVGKAIKQAQK